MLKSPLQCEDINVQGQGKLDIITSQVLKVNNIMHGFRLQHLVSCEEGYQVTQQGHQNISPTLTLI